MSLRERAKTLWPQLTLVALAAVLAGCAHTRFDAQTMELRVRTPCDALARTTLKAPIKTDVKGKLQAARAALAAGESARADQLSAALAAECREEEGRRRDLAQIVEAVERQREEIPPHVYAHFHDLVRQSRYTDAIVCGEGLAEANPNRCDLAPSLPARLDTIPIGKEKPQGGEEGEQGGAQQGGDDGSGDSDGEGDGQSE